MKVTTKSGFKFEIDENVLDDWRVMEAVVDAQDEDDSIKLRGTTRLVSVVFGKNKKAFFDHVAAKNNGRVNPDVVNEDTLDLFEQIGNLKNSSASPG